MADFSGSALYLAWIWSGGTVVLSDLKWRKFGWKPTVDFIDASGGHDTFETLTPGIGRGAEIPFEAVMVTGSTALMAAVAERNRGTLLYGPAGTVTGEVKVTIPAISMGPAADQPYDDIVTLAVNFRQTGAHTNAAW